MLNEIEELQKHISLLQDILKDSFPIIVKWTDQMFDINSIPQLVVNRTLYASTYYVYAGIMNFQLFDQIIKDCLNFSGLEFSDLEPISSLISFFSSLSFLSDIFPRSNISSLGISERTLLNIYHSSASISPVLIIDPNSFFLSFLKKTLKNYLLVSTFDKFDEHPSEILCL
jgi:hypothetical protein